LNYGTILGPLIPRVAPFPFSFEQFSIDFKVIGRVGDSSFPKEPVPIVEMRILCAVMNKVMAMPAGECVSVSWEVQEFHETMAIPIKPF
jgi:hypothetical protein